MLNTPPKVEHHQPPISVTKPTSSRMKQANSREIEKKEQYQWIQDLILLFLVSHFLYISVLYKCLYSLQHCLAYAKVCAGDSTEQQRVGKFVCFNHDVASNDSLWHQDRQDTPALSLKIP